MSVKDILVAAFNKDASSFETAFSSVMKEKVSAAVENRFFATEEYDLDEAKDEDEYDDEDEEDDEDELEEKKLTAKAVKNALASAKAKPKETVSLKKPPFKMEEVELDEVSASTLGSYIRKASKDADASMQKRNNALDNDDGETARKMGRLARKREQGSRKAIDKLTGSGFAKVHATEEVDSNEASE